MRPEGGSTRPGPEAEQDALSSNPSLAVACPACGRPVPVSLRLLAGRQPILCPAGHRLGLRDCAGVAQVVRMVGDLARPARLPRRGGADTDR